MERPERVVDPNAFTGISVDVDADAALPRIRLLVVAPYPILPATTGGKIRIFQLVKNLADHGIDVTVMTPYMPGQRQHVRNDDPFRLVQIPYPFVLPLLFTDRPLPYAFLVSLHPGMRWMVGRLLSQFDIIQFEHAYFAALLDTVPRWTPVVYNAHNVEFDYVRCECGSWVVQAVACARAHVLERRLARAAARILTCSKEDEQRLCELYGIERDKCCYAPNGIREIRVNHSYGKGQSVLSRLPGLEALSKYAIFSGSNVAHNRKAARALLETVAPSRADWAFILHGAVGERFARVKQPNVFFDRHIDGMECYAALGAVGLNPVTTGSGTNLKLLHYLANGMPVVSTQFGMRGMDDLTPYVTIRDVSEFAKTLNDGLTVPSGVAPCLEKYLWRNVAASITCVYTSLTASLAARSLPA